MERKQETIDRITYNLTPAEVCSALKDWLYETHGFLLPDNADISFTQEGGEVVVEHARKSETSHA